MFDKFTIWFVFVFYIPCFLCIFIIHLHWKLYFAILLIASFDNHYYLIQKFLSNTRYSHKFWKQYIIDRCMCILHWTVQNISNLQGAKSSIFLYPRKQKGYWRQMIHANISPGLLEKNIRYTVQIYRYWFFTMHN